MSSKIVWTLSSSSIGESSATSVNSEARRMRHSQAMALLLSTIENGLGDDRHNPQIRIEGEIGQELHALHHCAASPARTAEISVWTDEVSSATDDGEFVDDDDLEDDDVLSVITNPLVASNGLLGDPHEDEVPDVAILELDAVTIAPVLARSILVGWMPVV